MQLSCTAHNTELGGAAEHCGAAFLPARVIEIQELHSSDKLLQVPSVVAVLPQIEISLTLIMLLVVWGQQGPGTVHPDLSVTWLSVPCCFTRGPLLWWLSARLLSLISDWPLL